LAIDVNLLFGDAVDGLVENVAREIGRAGGRLRRWLSHVAVPIQGVRLHTPDGAEYTGLILVAGNRVIAMLVARHEPHAQLPEPLVTPPPRQPDYGYREDPRWREGDEMPFWRR
jgi:hypothetical protein